jgi:hypothetical protein
VQESSHDYNFAWLCPALHARQFNSTVFKKKEVWPFGSFPIANLSPLAYEAAFTYSLLRLVLFCFPYFLCGNKWIRHRGASRDGRGLTVDSFPMTFLLAVASTFLLLSICQKWGRTIWKLPSQDLCVFWMTNLGLFMSVTGLGRWYII